MCFHRYLGHVCVSILREPTGCDHVEPFDPFHPVSSNSCSMFFFESCKDQQTLHYIVFIDIFHVCMYLNQEIVYSLPNI